MLPSNCMRGPAAAPVGPDGVIAFSIGNRSGLWRISAEGGEPEPLTTPNRAQGEKTHRFPDILPDGSAVIFTIGTANMETFDDARIAIVSLETGEQKVVIEGGFLDGNGRVARLMTHATFLETLETGAMWSIARGLARHHDDYKLYLAKCDLSRRNDLDGRGPLSEEALASFTKFFLETCLDQVNFMEGLVQSERLRDRILLWVEEEVRAGALPTKSGQLLEAVLYRGHLPRRDVPQILETSERSARRVVSALLARGVLVSKSTRAPLFLAFPASLASRWMPGSFPEKPNA